MKVKQGSFATQSNFIGKKITAVMDATFAVTKRKPIKNTPGLYGIRTLDLCDTGCSALTNELTNQLEVSYESYFPKNVKNRLL